MIDLQLLYQYISEYKSNFHRINGEELYKWQAVKHFQDNWDISAPDFPSMLKRSIQKTENLLKSGQYFPLRMIVNFVDREPEVVRNLFANLYNEELDLETRITDFQSVTGRLNRKHFPDLTNTYQDFRAIVVYLVLRYPEVYYLYKFRMYKDFAKKLNLSFVPRKGKFETLLHYNKVCNVVRYHVAQDQDLLKLHKQRISDECYYDKNLHILTQDFIYAVAQHLSTIDSDVIGTTSVIQLSTSISASEFKQSELGVNFSGRFVNYIENNAEAKRIGDLGELWVYEQEKNKLLSSEKLRKKVDEIRHVSNENGDGTGFDIESYDLDGNKTFIEVKTTKYSFDTPFYISRNELERSKKEGGNYYLYRVYNFNEETNHADCVVIRGDLSDLCINPVSYRVNLKFPDHV